MRTQIKKVLKAVETKDKAGAQLAFRDAAAALDSSAIKGLVHKNNAARQKSHLNKRIRALARNNFSLLTKKAGQMTGLFYTSTILSRWMSSGSST